MSTEMTKLENVKKSCKTTAKVAKIFMIIIIVLAAICLAGAILCYVYRNQINTGISEALADENSNITVDFDTNLSFGSFSNLSFDLEEMYTNSVEARDFYLNEIEFQTEAR